VASSASSKIGNIGTNPDVDRNVDRALACLSIEVDAVPVSRRDARTNVEHPCAAQEWETGPQRRCLAWAAMHARESTRQLRGCR